MSRAYDNWIHQQLEPTDRIIMGNSKRIHEIKRNIVMPNPSPDYRSEQQIQDDEDKYLAAHGVPINPRSK